MKFVFSLLVALLFVSSAEASPLITWLGASTIKATDYGGVTPAEAFPYIVSQTVGYDMTNGQVDSRGYYRTNGYINAGVDSADIANMSSRLSSLLADSPTTLVLQAGLQDYVENTSLSTFGASVESILNSAKTAGAKVVCVNDVYERGSVSFIQGYYTYLLQFEQSCAAAGAPVVDIYREYLTYYVLQGYTAFNALYADGTVHQSIAGNAWIANVLTRQRYTAAGIF